MGMETVLVGFGGNLGDVNATCRSAIDRLNRQTGFKVLRVSSLYKTEPVGKTDQDPFINGVLMGETSLPPEELLDLLLEVERYFGRVRRERWGPRTLDLDLLDYSGRVMETPRLNLPHPRLHERRFVLVPLVEIAPAWVHPVLGKTAEELLVLLDEAGQEVVKIV